MWTCPSAQGCEQGRLVLALGGTQARPVTVAETRAGSALSPEGLWRAAAKYFLTQPSRPSLLKGSLPATCLHSSSFLLFSTHHGFPRTCSPPQDIAHLMPREACPVGAGGPLCLPL